MGQNMSIQNINFEDMQYAIKNKYIIMNTLPENKQNCLILGTLHAHKESDIINDLIKKRHFTIPIVIYGYNYKDDTVYNKYKQLYSFGFRHLYVYMGGLFEWLCLQDIYGDDEFQTTKKELDLLHYRPKNEFIPKLPPS